MSDLMITTAYLFSALVLARAGMACSVEAPWLTKVFTLSTREAHVVSCSSIAVAYAFHAVA